MSDEILGKISDSLTRIEGTLDGFTGQFAQHVSDDAAVAADVKALARQRGFVLTGLTAVGAGIAAGAAYVVRRWLVGQH
jgi:hypothetical protein